MAISTMYDYYWGRYLEGFISDHVTMISTFRAMQAKGACEEQYYTEKDSLSPSQNLLSKAEENRIYTPISYYHLNIIDQVKETMLLEGSVIITIPLYESFDEAEAFGLVPMPGENEEVIDLHSIYIVGYEGKKCVTSPNGSIFGSGFFKFANSYGIEWGEDGFGYFSYEYFNEYCHEAYALNWIDSRWLKTPIVKLTYILNPGGKVYIRLHNITMKTSWLKAHILLFAYLDNNRIGWISGFVNLNNMVEIEDFFVWPDYRGKGLGSMLLSTYIEYCSKYFCGITGWLNYLDAQWDGIQIITAPYIQRGFAFEADTGTNKWAKGKFTLVF